MSEKRIYSVLVPWTRKGEAEFHVEAESMEEAIAKVRRKKPDDCFDNHFDNPPYSALHWRLAKSGGYSNSIEFDPLLKVQPADAFREED